MLRLDMACEDFVPLVTLSACRKSASEETGGVVPALCRFVFNLDHLVVMKSVGVAPRRKLL